MGFDFRKLDVSSNVIFVCLLITLFAMGCNSVPLDISGPVPNQKYKELGYGEGKATGIMLFGFIPIGQNNRFVRAYDRAIAEKNGDSLINPTIEERWFWIPILTGYSTTVSGTIIKYTK